MSEMADAEESLNRAERLMERLEEARGRLEAATEPDQAIEVLSELAEIAREIEAEIAKAKRATDAEP